MNDTKQPSVPEGRLVAAVLEMLQLSGCMSWRQNNLPSFTVIARGKAPGTAIVRFHRGVVRKGISDVGGVTPTGRIIQIECKRPGQKPSSEQSGWLSAIASSGGIAMLCTDIKQVEVLCNEARLTGWDRMVSPWTQNPRPNGGRGKSWE